MTTRSGRLGEVEWDIVPGRPIAVAGDVHGRSGDFRALLERLSEEAPGAELVLLGDLVDRGPDSLGCLRLAARAAREFGFSRRTLVLGNHELMMLAALGMGPLGNDRRFARELWLRNGGETVVEEVLSERPGTDAGHPLELRDALLDAIGEEAALMLEEGVSHVRSGNVVLCHAGLHPRFAGTPGEWFARTQWTWVDEGEHHAWIRWPFLQHEGEWPEGLRVVHGHTPSLSVLRQLGLLPARTGGLPGPVPVPLEDLARPFHNRLGLDGGTNAHGALLGAVLRDGVFTPAWAADPELSARCGIVLPPPPHPAP